MFCSSVPVRVFVVHNHIDAVCQVNSNGKWEIATLETAAAKLELDLKGREAVFTRVNNYLNKHVEEKRSHVGGSILIVKALNFDWPAEHVFVKRVNFR